MTYLEQRRTKIVCTLGPASKTNEVLEKMIKSGMNVARVNFSHGSDQDHEEYINLVNDAAKNTGRFVGILMDLKGPKIRVGKFENGQASFKKGDKINVFLEAHLGNHDQFSIAQPELFLDVKPGDMLLVDDGKVILTVNETSSEKMVVQVENDGIISDNKGINAPGVVLTMPFVSEKDENDLKFGIKKGVNAVACSFVRRPQDVLDIRKILDDNGGSDIEIIAKIENQEGVDNIEKIVEVANGIMVARGDMGVEVPLELVPVYQKKIIKLCNMVGKPVITATHMLESMIHCPRPTRAEAGDVANAVLDGSDAVMLSGESAIGEYPVEAVSTMSKIISEIETIIDYRQRFQKLSACCGNGINDAIGVSVASCSLSLSDAKAVFAFTDTGGTAKRISRFRPAKPIIACTDNIRTCQRLTYYWGVNPILVHSVEQFLEHDSIAKEESRKLGFKEGDIIIMTSGFGMEHGQTNTIRLLVL
ncbi:MAG: pyruvate kinase [Bacillales bacterium]|nr:pyruvate kinase [Bacillales bacterium]